MKMDWWLAGVCFSRMGTGLVFMNYAAVLPVLQQEWSMNAAQSGSVISGFHLGYTISLVFCSILADRVGGKPIFMASMAAGALFSAAFAFLARDYVSALILYSLIGLSLGGAYTTGLMIMAERYPVQRRGSAMGFFIASTSLGYALSLLVCGLCLPLGGYRLAFMVTCLGPVLGAGTTWAVLRKTPNVVVKREGKQRFVKEVLKNKPGMLLIGGYTCHSYEILGTWAWCPAFIAAALTLGGADTVQAAGTGSHITAFFHVAGLVASSSMGFLSDRLGRARVLLALAAISAVISLVFGWTLGWPIYLITVLGLVYAFTGLGDSPVLSAALSENVSPAYLGTAYGIRSLLGFGAGSLAPFAFGLILDAFGTSTQGGSLLGWGVGFTHLGLVGLGAALMAYLLGREIGFRPKE